MLALPICNVRTAGSNAQSKGERDHVGRPSRHVAGSSLYSTQSRALGNAKDFWRAATSSESPSDKRHLVLMMRTQTHTLSLPLFGRYRISLFVFCYERLAELIECAAFNFCARPTH
jgi:hypothetical protein